MNTVEKYTTAIGLKHLTPVYVSAIDVIRSMEVSLIPKTSQGESGEERTEMESNRQKFLKTE